eukprot:Clim_evm49s201 gene=Clim_evmTU49s201
MSPTKELVSPRPANSRENSPRNVLRYALRFSAVIEIISGHNLVAKDRKMGRPNSSDPYVILSAGVNQFKTKVINKNLNPVWNETFHLPVEEFPLVLKFKVYDRDRFDSDDFLGTATVSLSEKEIEALIEEGKEDEGEVEKLLKLEKIEHGEIRVKVHLRRISLQLGKRESDLDPISHNYEGILRLTLKSARSIKASDRGGTSDPYCVIRYDTKEWRTKVVPKTLNPDFNEFIQIWLPQNRSTDRRYGGDSVIVTVWDKDQSSTDDFLGTVAIPVSCFKDQSHADFDLPLTNRRYHTDLSISVPSADAKSKTKGDAAENKPAEELVTETEEDLGTLQFSATFATVQEAERGFWEVVASYFDADGNNTLDPVELAAMLNTIGTQLSDEEMDSLFGEMDTDKDGVISPLELYEYMSERAASENLIKINRCPVCAKGLDSTVCARDKMAHIGLCLKHNKAVFDSEVLGSLAETNGFISESKDLEQVQQSKILVKERTTGYVVEEAIPAYIRTAMKTMYRRKVGRGLTEAYARKLLAHMTKKMNKAYNDPKSVSKIPGFVSTYSINMDEVLKPADKFDNFNDFFARQLKPGARPIDSPDDDCVAVSPADCRMMIFPTVNTATEVWIKGNRFSVDTLLQDPKNASKFYGGSLVIARLAPQDYHRWHFPVTGKLESSHSLPGEYYTVSPLAVRTAVNVYTENRRIVSYIETKEFGNVALVSIGATMVGTIVILAEDGSEVKKGAEHGYFAFGGSTCILLFEPNAIDFDADILENSSRPMETLIRMGSRIGVSRKRPPKE